MARSKSLDIFSGLKRDTIRRNSQRSSKWLINKIRNMSGNSVNTRSIPKIGQMYLYVYDAKTKDVLPFWDAAPLVIPVQFEKAGFSGINFHYLPPNDRLVLFKLLAGMSSRAYIRISYAKLRALSSSGWKFAYKRYLYSHMRSKFLMIEHNEWNDALMLPIANFQKKTQSYVHRIYKKRF